MIAPELPPPAAATQPSALLAPLLAGVAGFVDTTGFIAFAGVFLAHVTGNFVVLGAMISGQEHGSAAANLSVLPLFIAGVVLGWIILRGRGGSGPRLIAAAESGALLICGGVSMFARSNLPHSSALEATSLALGVLAMGMQSMLARSLKLPMTHVMTGNVTQLTVDLLDARFRHAATAASARRNIALVAAFACGAAAAGFLVPVIGLAAMCVPGVVLAFLAAAKRLA